MNPRRLHRLTLFATYVLCLCAAGLAALSLLLGPVGRSGTIVLVGKRLRPDWYVITWGTTVSRGENGLLVAPQKPGTAWVGFRLQRARVEASSDPLRPRLSAAHVKRGVLQFSLRGAARETGGRQAEPPLQVFLYFDRAQRTAYALRIRPWHCESEDPRTGWKQYALPLFLFDLKPHCPLFGVEFQVVGPLRAAFEASNVAVSLRSENALRMLAKPPPGTASFPAVVELPPHLRKPPVLKLAQGTFTSEGTTCFLLGTQLSYDMRVDLWGYSLRPPHQSKETWSGYGPELRWLYEALPERNQFARVGFNTYCVLAPPEIFLSEFLPLPLPKREAYDPNQLPLLAQRLDMQAVVDLTPFRWTVGLLREAGVLPRDALSPRKSHNMPFSLTEKGMALYLQYAEKTLSFFKKHRIPVLQVELFNEPDYPPGSPLHTEEFAQFLKALVPEKRKLAERCGIPATADVYRKAASCDPTSSLWLFFAHARFLRDRFLTLLRRLRDQVKELLGPTPVSVQLNRSDFVQGTPLIDPEALLKELPVVTAPTDGGIWTYGRAERTRPGRAILSSLAPAPLTADLLRTFSEGKKPIIDQEFYAPGSPETLLAELHLRLLLGYQGLYLFSWSKRAWQWHTEEEGRRVAERFPFCLLNPYAHPPAELAAIHTFRMHLEKWKEAGVADLLLGRGESESPQAAFLHSYTNELAHRVIPTARESSRAVYAALRYSHIPFSILTERIVHECVTHSKPLPPILFCAGITVFPSEHFASLKAYVRKGGILVAVNAPFERTPEATSLTAEELLGCRFGAAGSQPVELSAAVPPSNLPGPLRGYAFCKLLLKGAEALVRDKRGDVRVARHLLGRGRVYTVSFRSESYSLLRLIAYIAGREGVSAPFHLRFADTGEHAVNVLASLRKQSNSKLLSLANQDGYRKVLTLTWPQLEGSWRCTRYSADGPRASGTLRPGVPLTFALVAGEVCFLHFAAADSSEGSP